MTETENRLFKLEQYVYYTLAQQIRTLQDLVNALRNALNQGGGFGGGGGDGPQYFGCTLSAALAHGSSVTGQTVWKLEAGSRTTVSTTATVYNDGPNAADDVASGKQAILAANDDGTYTATGVYC